MIRWSAALAYPIAFAASFCILLLEITAGRFLAPAVGVSLETWTGIIGVVLAGFALGDAIGGRLADRAPSPRLLAGALLAAAATVMLVPAAAGAARGAILAAPLMARVVVAAVLVFLVPATLLGAVSPITARLTLRAMEDAGRTVGWLGAAGTVGSLLGVLVGGFYLMEEFGVHTIALGAGLALAALAIPPLLAVLPPSDDEAPKKRGRPDRSERGQASVWPRPWVPYVLPAFSGAAIMAIELAAGRLVAPALGTSLYTWSSLIGTVLLGIAAGNALGGWLADRDPSRRLLGNMFFYGGWGALVLLFVAATFVRPTFYSMPAVVVLPLLFGGLVVPPSLFLGTISPVVIRLSFRAVPSSGDLVGRVYASQAIGSILGTFLTGFVLVSHLGARAVIVLAASLAVLTGALVGDPRPRVVQPLVRAGAAAAFVGALVASLAGWIPSPCLRESNYFCIRVDVLEDIRVLRLDRLIHSYVNMKNPTALEYDYEHGYAMLVADYASRHPGRRLQTLSIGGGAYVFPRYIERLYAGSVVDVVEIDPAVTEVTYERLGMSRATTIRTWNEDGRLFFLRGQARQYDLIFGDAFNDYAVPYHLTTLEFARMVAASLRPGGVYAANVIDGRHGLFLRSYLATLGRAFRHVYVMPAGDGWRTSVRTTFVVFASQEPLDLERIAALRPRGVPEAVRLVILSEFVLADYLKKGPSMILTDDHVPVDNFLAVVYAESAQRTYERR